MTPYESLLACAGPCALFESTTPPGSLSRLSLLARDPRALLVVRDGEMLLATPQGVQRSSGSPWAMLRSLVSEIPEGSWPEEGGLACVLAYDLARPARHEAGTPVFMALAVDRFLVFEDGRPLRPLPMATAPRLPAIPSGPNRAELRAGGIEIVSASPERLLRVEGDRVSTRPIAGTRPRSPDPSRDAGKGATRAAEPQPGT